MPRLRILLPLLLLPLTSGCVVHLGEDGTWWQAWSWPTGRVTVEGDGTIAEEQRLLGEVERVRLSGSFDVQVDVLPELREARARLVADGNLLEHLLTEVRDGQLRVEFEEGVRARPTRRPRVVLELPRLRRLDLSGAHEVSAEGLAGEEFDLVLAGSGHVTASGAVAELRVRVAGSGELDLAQLDARSVELSVAGSSEVEVRARERLEVSIAGSGQVRYHGDPATDLRIAGSGDVRRVR